MTNRGSLDHSCFVIRHQFVIRHSGFVILTTTTGRMDQAKERVCFARCAAIYLGGIRAPEKVPGIDVAGQAARWNASQIITPAGVRAPENSGCRCVPRIGPAARRNRTIRARPIFLNSVSNQRARGSAGRSSDRGTADIAGSSAANNGASRCTITGARAGGAFTRIQRKRH